jgi:cell wall-associated NlpC family hydrolase
MDGFSQNCNVSTVAWLGGRSCFARPPHNQEAPIAQMHQKLLFLCILSLGACSGEPPVAELEPAPPAVASEPAASEPASPLPPQQEIVQQALAAVGVSYRRGGQSPDAGFDCSGLVVHVYREAFGLVLPRTAKAQSESGRAVRRGELRPGDLVFYNTRNRPFSHVGIYLGEGRFVHSPKPGAAVRVERMAVGYWSKRYEGARRIVPDGPGL